MTALDMAMLLLMGWMAVTGFMRGFVQEVLSLLAWVVAVIAVRLFLAPVTDMVGALMGAGAAASMLAFVGLFAVTFFAGKMLAHAMGDRVCTSVIGSVDRVLGAGFGLLKGLVVATVAFLAFTLAYNLVFGADALRPSWMTGARSYPLLNASGAAMRQMVRSRTDTDEDATPESAETL